MAEVPLTPMRMGSSDLKSSVQTIFLAGYFSSFDSVSNLCIPSGEMEYFWAF